LLAPLFFEARECSTVIGFNIPPSGMDDLTARNNDDVYIFQWFNVAKQLANETFRPVPHNRVTNFLGGGDAEARRAGLVSQGEAGHQTASVPNAVVIDPCKLRPAAQFHRDDETVSRLRPFARRRFKTVRPFLVCMRTRNP
jgi:hypothetical protein